MLDKDPGAMQGTVSEPSAEHPPHSTALSDTRWYCVAIFSNLERTAQASLNDLGLSTLFLKIATRVPGSSLDSLEPWRIRSLFPGYGFVAFDQDLDPWQKISDVNGVYRLFRHAPEKPTPLPSKDIEALRDQADQFGVIYPRPKKLISKGARCKPMVAPYENLTGICEWTDGERIRLLTHMLGSSKATITLSVSDVEVMA